MMTDTDVLALRAENEQRQRELRRTLARQLEVLRNWVCSVLFLVPISLVAAPSPWHWAGWAYLVIYSLRMLPAGGMHILMAYDAWRVIQNKPVVFVQHILAVGIAMERRHGDLEPPLLIKLIVWGNPLLGVAIGMTDLCRRINPEGMLDVWAQAQRLASTSTDDRKSGSVAAAADEEALAWKHRLPLRRKKDDRLVTC